MNRFLSGKINKELFVLILIFVPMIAAALIFSCDYGLSAVISIICLIFFMKKMKKGALEFQISQISKTKISTSGLLIALAVMIQILLFTFVYRTGNLFVKEDWNKYIDIIKPILVAPVVEELFFRWASTEICIDKDTSKGRCALFLVVMLIIWTLAHGVLNINLGVTFIGAILYYIYFKTQNILHCILFHSATNISYVVLLSSFQNKVRFLFEKNLFLILVCILVVLESIYLMFRLKSETKKEKCEIQEKTLHSEEKMYKFEREKQLTLEDFDQPLGMKMNPENRWVIKASIIPWETIEAEYSQLFPSKTGMPAKPLRMALGSLLIQKQYGFSDEELVEQIRENPYYQYFVGLPRYEDKIPFVPSLLVEFRKRLPEDKLVEINEMIIEYYNHLVEESKSDDDSDNDSHGGGSKEEKIS